MDEEKDFRTQDEPQTDADGHVAAGGRATLVLAQDKKPPAAPPPPKGRAPGRDPYAPTEVAIRPDFWRSAASSWFGDFSFYHVIAPGRAIRYGVAVGKDELVWKACRWPQKTEWPSWKPTPAMDQRKPAQYGKWADGRAGGLTEPRWVRGRFIFTMPRAMTPRSASMARPSRARSGARSRTVPAHAQRGGDGPLQQIPVGTPVYVY